MTELRTPERFRFSASIEISRLERENRRLLWLGVVFAAVFHLFLGMFVHFRSPASLAVKTAPVKEWRVKVDLIEGALDAANPYDTWTGPARTLRGRKAFQPGVPSVSGNSLAFKRAPSFSTRGIARDGFRVDTDSLIQAIVRGGAAQRSRRVVDPNFPPPPVWREYKPSRKAVDSPNTISMRDEMLRVEDLNTGKYKGMVVLNLADERDIKGYLSFPSTVSGERLRVPGETARFAAGLAQALRRFTGIIARPDSQMALTSPTFAKFPFVYIAADDLFDLSDEERTALGNYLRAGGFAFVESYGGDRPELPLKGSGPLRKMLRDALGIAGELRPLPADHFLYHCYFDFPDGPPRTKREETGKPVGQPAGVLEGAWVGDRLAAVYSEKGYGRAWSRPGSSEEYLRMGINIVVYALTQNGGLTVRLVDESGGASPKPKAQSPK